jgi:hypothetical protein
MIGESLAGKLRDRMDTEIVFVGSGILDEAIGQRPTTPGEPRRVASSTAHPGHMESMVEDMLRATHISLRPQIVQDHPALIRRNPRCNMRVCGLEVQHDPCEDPDERVAGYPGEHTPISTTVERRMQAA